jgi:Tfp pilus assembly protein PilV
MIEISLALLVVAMGLLILMSLLPSGLKEVESATENTRAAMFADDQFNGYQANALKVESPAEFQLLPHPVSIFGNFDTGDVRAEPYPGTNGGPLRWKYFVKLNTTVTSSPVWRVRLEVKNGASGPFTKPVVFYTELIYGAPPP